MHTQVSEVAALWAFVVLRSKTRKTLLVDEAPKRICASHKHVDSQIELKAIDKIRFVEVALSNIMLSLDNPVAVSSKKDAPALAHRLWLDDESLGSLVIELLSKAFAVRGEDPSLRKEIEIIGHRLLHGVQVAGQKVLASERVDSW